MDRRVDLALSVAIVALGLFVIVVASGIKLGLYKDAVGPRAFFYGCGVVFILGGLFLVGQRLYLWPRESGNIVTAEGGDDEAGYPVTPWRVWALILVALLYAALFRPLGYLLATPLYLATTLYILDVKRPALVAAISVIFTGFFYYIFAQVLNVRIPVGPLTSFFREMGWVIL